MRGRLRSLTVAVCVLAFVLVQVVSVSATADVPGPPSPSATSTSSAWNFKSWISRALNWGPPVDCTYNDKATGSSFDFRKMRKMTGDFTGTDRTYKYQMNMCGETNTVSLCQAHHGSVCQFSGLTGNYVANLGSWVGAPQPTWGLLDPKDPSQGVQLTFRNGDICWINHGHVTRTTNVNLICADVQDETFTVQEVFGTCTFNIRIRTPYACVGGAAASSWSLTSILGFIVFLAAVYLVVGCYWNVERNGKQWGTLEAVPNLEFWQSVPVMTKDGFDWTASKISEWRGGAPAGYEKVAAGEEPAAGDKDKKKSGGGDYDDI